MDRPTYLPHIDLLLRALRINRERLGSRAKIAIDARLLRGLIQAIVARDAFSEEFYLATYPDVAEAHAAGTIPDPHQHYVETGYFEGRMGSPPPLDEGFYTRLYRDVAQAVAKGDVKSGLEHYLRQGAAEGRIPCQQGQPEVNHWMALLSDDIRGG
jgi:hypothetical protein